MSCVVGILSLAALLGRTGAYEDMPAARQALQSDVVASEGGTVTLRCLFHGNTPSNVTWRYREHTIDDNVGRYRLMSDGALMIVPLYRNDTGVYICVADNGHGVATQEIHLAVNDPVRMPVAIAGDESAAVTGELGSPLHVRCLAYGYPPPSVFWYRGYEGVMVPYNDAVYEAKGNVLLIRSLALETLGQYTCQAYNEENKPAASWVVFVQAYMPEGLSIDNEFFVPRHMVVPRPTIQPPTTAETTTTTTTSATTEAPTDENTTVTGELDRRLHVRCLAYGYPPPFVFWYRGSEKALALYNDTKHEVRGNDLIFRNLSIDTLGQYTCRAYNGVGKVASWGLIVRAYMPEGLFIENEWLVPRGTVAPRPRTLPPINATTTTTTTTTITEAPIVLFTDLLSAPLALPQQESEVSAVSEGGAVTLRCLFHANPSPKITWRFGNFTIDDNVGRYRLMSDGALMIVPLYRNDTGVYICVADNGHGVATQEIHLAVNASVASRVWRAVILTPKK